MEKGNIKISKAKFAQLKNMATKNIPENIFEKLKSNENLRNEDNEAINNRLLVDVLNANEDILNPDNCDTEGDMDTFYVSDKLKDRNFEKKKRLFKETKYSAPESYSDFFFKYKNFAEITRKGTLKKMTPSYGFIKATNEHMLVPNPIGLVKRKGEDHKINLK
jgi:hypothetical protein